MDLRRRGLGGVTGQRNAAGEPDSQDGHRSEHRGSLDATQFPLCDAMKSKTHIAPLPL
jgi:hypothetical protein